ncbi:TIGR04211 family SH3 domain-containing protein [Orbus sasakiae]|uniref:TIGR04211 family SH3 domain-containing protein n=1 Tax=Orbus sasakiae TaxID=1078475 RepID=A0ABP9NAV8_9GAMM
MYKKKLLLVFILFLASLAMISFAAFAADKYITDDLSVYLRRGPGTQYGLIGSLKSGDKVTELETSSDGKYTRIKDDRNRISWVESELLTNSPSLKEQLPALEQQIAILQEKESSATQDKQTLIDDYTSQLTIANQKIAELEKQNNVLQTQTKEQVSQIESLNNQLDERRQSLMLTWFTRGGLVAGIGLILGLILPLVIPRRRKKDRWMS